MHRTLAVFLSLIFLPGSRTLGAEKEALSWNHPAQSLRGPTGYIKIPSSEVVDYKHLSLGLHRFGLGFLYSWPKNVEYGFSFDLKEITTSSLDETRRRISPNAKIRWVNSARWGQLATGFYRKTYYLVYEREWGPPTIAIEGGGSVTNFAGVNTGNEFLAIVYKTGLSRYILELDGRSLEPSAGWRYMLSSSMAIDLAWTNMREIDNKFENFVFGLTMLWGKS